MARHHTSAAAGDGVNTTRPAKHQLLQHILRILRILQFLSALISLIFFSLRIHKIIKLAGRASHSNGAVEGILAAAVLYTLIATVLQLAIKGTRSNLLRMLLVIFDILFVGAFIAVAVLTSPSRHGSSAPCTSRSEKLIQNLGRGNADCRLPLGTFILAIFSTLLHAATAAFHAAKDQRRARKNEAVHKEAFNNHSAMDNNHNVVDTNHNAI